MKGTIEIKVEDLKSQDCISVITKMEHVDNLDKFLIVNSLMEALEFDKWDKMIFADLCNKGILSNLGTKMAVHLDVLGRTMEKRNEGE